MSAPEQDPHDGTGVSRRVLIGGGLLVLGAIGGGVAGFATTDAPREVVPDPVPPTDVLAAIARENDLIARYDAATTPDPLWTHIRAEHQAHVDALTALLPAGTSTAPSTPVTGSVTGSGSPTGSPATPVTAAELVAAERQAADAARAACLAGNGTAAVLLACIAASETTHAAVLA